MPEIPAPRLSGKTMDMRFKDLNINNYFL